MMLSNSLLCVLRSGSDYHKYRVLRTSAASGGGTRLENATAQVIVMMIHIQILSPHDYECIYSRSSCRNLSVRPSNACTLTKQNNLLPIFLYPVKDPFIWFPDRKNGCWGTTPCIWNLEPNWPRTCNSADFQSIFARNASAVRPSEKCSMPYFVLFTWNCIGE